MNSTVAAMRRTTINAPSRHRQAGASAVEFALTAVIFFTLLLGSIEFGRLLYMWNSAAEATRLGARLAVVCAPGDSANIITKMRDRMPMVPTSAPISIDYAPSACTDVSCQRVTVSIGTTSVPLIVPFLNFSMSLPPFSTSLPRESMNSGGDNPDCV